ncbi:hypothetical protein Q4519_17270 [Motilimonas sp. 1_MG-2023]|uniref:sulfotransferase family protein n=1 Tax=Motilimonas sp. 1_MG-2023 TaxID=3062672 RepID=UPI0026E13E69|nr:hypothetical protein [Motilimonas sp. 1_MG-2023]MDO6527433.1 hypothetical protein [Motilimonas sp. 1_MG-2023]
MANQIAILILGMHRSGTSALTGMLGKAGIPLGTEFIDDVADVNKKGFWEHKRLVEINEAILAHLGKSWFSLDVAAELSNVGLFELAKFKQQAITFIETEFSGAPIFALKDPRMCVLAEFWLDVFQSLEIETKVIVLNRMPDEVAASLYKRDKLPVLIAQQLWLEHTLGCLRVCQLQFDVVTIISFEDFLNDPSRFLTKVLQQFSLAIPINIDAASGFVEPNLRRQHCHEQQKNLANDLYNALNTADFDLDRVLQEYQQKCQQHSQQNMPYLVALTEAFIAMNREIIAHQHSEAKLTRLGQSHSLALATIDERDKQLDEFNLCLNKQREELSYAVTVVEERDQQLNDLAKELAHAVAVVKERDQQLANLYSQLKQEGAAHGHAISVIEERDAQLTKVIQELAALQQKYDDLDSLSAVDFTWRKMKRKLDA